MKKFILLMALLLSGFVFQAKASHLMGGDFRVIWLGGNDYDITLTLYRDCSGIAMPTDVSIAFNSAATNFSVVFPLSSFSDITPVCSGTTTNCGGGSLFGYQKYIYSKQITLAPAEWTISYHTCCRNPCNSLITASAQAFYIYFTFNPALAPGNQPPYFTADPVSIIKNYSDFHYNYGVFDPEGDSVTIKLVNPLQDTNSLAFYVSPFNAQQFIFSNPPIFEDQVNGDLIIHPTAVMSGVYAVEVIEWNTQSGSPVMVSKQIRDMWIQVINDTSGVPVLSGINPQATAYNANDTIYHMSVMAGDTIDFTIFPYQQNPPTNLTLSYPKQIPGATHTISQNNTPNATGHFFWVPTSTQIVQGPAVFVTRMIDKRCPYFNEQLYSYSFDVGGLIIFLLPNNPNVNLLLGQLYSLSATCATANTFAWYVDGVMVQSGPNATYSFLSQDLGPGDHTVGCKAYNSAKSDMQGFEYVNVHVENIWGISQAMADKIKIYPNPANNVLNIEGFANSSTAEVHDVNGKLLLSAPLQNEQIDISPLAKGLYFIKFSTQEGSVVRKFIKE